MLEKKVANSRNGEESSEVSPLFISCPLHQLVAFSFWFFSQFLTLGLVYIRFPEPF